MDDITKQRLNQLNPLFGNQIEQIITNMETSGYKVRIVQGLRTFKEQADLYAQGRSKPGKIVTNAPAGESWHNYAIAVDLVPGLAGTDSYFPDWEPNVNGKLKSSWEMMFTEARKLGLTLGYDWHFQDMPHLQSNKVPTSPTHEDVSLLDKKGAKEVWKKYGLL